MILKPEQILDNSLTSPRERRRRRRAGRI